MPLESITSKTYKQHKLLFLRDEDEFIATRIVAVTKIFPYQRLRNLTAGMLFVWRMVRDSVSLLGP